MISGGAQPVGTGTVLAPPDEAAPTEGVPLVEQPEAPIAAQPKSRAQQVQERLKPGQTYQKKFKTTGETVTLSGKEGQEAKGYQYWAEEQAAGLDTLTAAENAQKRIIAEKGVPPKFINDLAGARTKAQIVAGEAAARETATRGAAITRPKNSEEYRAAAASGLTTGYVVGRSLKDDDLIAVQSQGLVLMTLPDGTRVAVPREEALTSGSMILEPTVMLAEKAARKIANKSTSQSQNAQMILSALDSVETTGALDLFVKAAPGIGGSVKAEIEAQTKNRIRLFDLRRHGDPRAIAIDAFRPLATAFVKAMGDTGQITEPDKRAFLDFFGRVASGTATRQEAAARMNQLRGMIQSVLPKGDSQVPENREGTPRANTTTTLPYNARVLDE